MACLRLIRTGKLQTKVKTMYNNNNNNNKTTFIVEEISDDKMIIETGFNNVIHQFTHIRSYRILSSIKKKKK